MKTYMLSFLLPLLLLCWGCGQSSDRVASRGLRKLSVEEIIQRAWEHRPLSPYMVFKDSLGNELDAAGRELLNAGILAADQYVNKGGEVVEMVTRKATYADELLAILVDEAYRPSDPAPPIPIECADQRRIMEELAAKDRAMERAVLRTDLNRLYDIDRENQIVLVNLIEQCGFPTREAVGEAGMDGLFLVFLHAPGRLMARYYPLLKKSVESGDLPPGRLAELEDYLLSLHGREQMYGTQIRFDPKAGHNILYPLRDSATVDQRRAAVGLGALKDHLREWEVEVDH